MSIVVYRIALKFYYFLLVCLSPFNQRAKKWINGQRQSFDFIPYKTGKIVWIHASSLGEFEQGRPVMEAIKKEFPLTHIILTFFSPSGYEIRKNYEQASVVTYLPLDSPKNAKRFIDKVKPDVAIFIKYDFWYFYFRELGRRKIPLFVVSAMLRADHLFFNWYAGGYSKLLNAVTWFFVQDTNSKVLLGVRGFTNASMMPDTRIDRVEQIMQSMKLAEIDEIKAFCGNEKILIAGSSYETEEKMIRQMMDEGVFNGKVIVVPHDVSPAHISKTKQTFPGAVIWSEKKANDFENQANRVLIIDVVGLLSRIYKYGHIAFIGGGFGKCVHNTLEPAAFGLPIITGPNGSEKFLEIQKMTETGGAFVVRSQAELNAVIKSMSDDEFRMRCSRINREFIESNLGGSEMVLKAIDPYLS